MASTSTSGTRRRRGLTDAEVERRQQEVVRLRRQRKTYDEIAGALGYRDESGARRAAERAGARGRSRWSNERTERVKKRAAQAYRDKAAERAEKDYHAALDRLRRRHERTEAEHAEAPTVVHVAAAATGRSAKVQTRRAVRAARRKRKRVLNRVRAATVVPSPLDCLRAGWSGCSARQLARQRMAKKRAPRVAARRRRKKQLGRRRVR